MASRSCPARRARHLCVLAVLPFVFFTFTQQAVLGCGATLHYFFGDVAREKLEPGSPLRRLLEDNRNAYQSGLVFPDLMHGVRDTDESDEKRKEGDAATYTHSPQFFTDYLRALREQAENKDLSKAERDRIKAHFLGIIGHIVADINYDNRYVTSVYDACYADEKDSDLTAKAKIMRGSNRNALGKFLKKKGGEKRKEGEKEEEEAEAAEEEAEAAEEEAEDDEDASEERKAKRDQRQARRDSEKAERKQKRGARKEKRGERWAKSAQPLIAIAQHYGDQTVDAAAFETLPPEREFRKASGWRRDIVQNRRNARRENRAERREGTRRGDRRESELNQEDRIKLWNRIRPTSAFVPSRFLDSFIKKQDVDVGGRDRVDVFNDGGQRQWSFNTRVKAKPGSPRAKQAFRRAEKECPRSIDYENDDRGWYWGPGGVDETAEILAEMMQKIWDEWEQGAVIEFRAGPCRVHDHSDGSSSSDGEPNEDLTLGQYYEDGMRDKWKWLHKNLCMRFSTEFAKNPSGPSMSTVDVRLTYEEHCMYDTDTRTQQRALNADFVQVDPCGSGQDGD